MVPDKFNMVDMGGIDLIMMQGEAVPGLYDKLMDAISNCQYQCLYNWMFDSVLIPPTYVQMTVVDGEIYLNGGVSVSSDDVIHIYTISPGPTPPAIISLLAEENGTYTAPSGVDGFNPVTVDIPAPLLQSKTVLENGLVLPDSGYYGLSSVDVQVPNIGIEGTLAVYTGKTSINKIFDFSGNVKILVMALNAEASTYNLNLSVTKNGNSISVETIGYHQYTGQSPNTRNYRLGLFSSSVSIGDEITISCDHTGYVQLMVVITTFEFSSIDLAMTSNDARITGSSSIGDYVFYGYVNGASNIGKGILIPYTVGETVDTGAVPTNYGAGYIFWLS